MSAVLMLTTSAAVNVPGWLLALGVVLAAALGAVLQWATSAKQGRRLTAVMLASGFAVYFMLIWDCGWMPDWACYFPLW